MTQTKKGLKMKELLKAMQTAVKFAERKDNSAITSHLLLECINNTLTITATDLEMSYETSIAFNNDDFCATANAADLLAVIKGMNDDETIKFSVTNNELIISIAQNKSKLIGFDTNEYPQNPKTDGALIFENFNMEPLYKILPAIDKNNLKYELNGAFYNGEIVVATNTKILKIVPTNYAPLEVGYIIPRDFISTMKTLKIDTAKAYFKRDYLILEHKNERFFIKLINGKFPDYTRIVPREFAINLNIKADLMLKILDKFKVNEIKMTISPFRLDFESLSEEGALKQSFETRDYKSTKTDKSPAVFEVAFSRNFIKAAIGDKSQDLNMVFNAPHMPFMVKNDDAYTVIMPIFLA